MLLRRLMYGFSIGVYKMAVLETIIFHLKNSFYMAYISFL